MQECTDMNLSVFEWQCFITFDEPMEIHCIVFKYL